MPRIIRYCRPSIKTLWAERLDYSKRKLSQALDTFRRTRAENYEFLKDLPEETFARTGQHSKRGTITLLDLLRIFAEHPEKHVQQIHAARAAFKEFKAGADPVRLPTPLGQLPPLRQSHQLEGFRRSHSKVFGQSQ